MNGREKPSYRFKSFLLNVGERQLLRGDEAITLTPKVFDTLVCLVENAGHLVEKTELMESVWRDSIVEEGNLSRSIHALRRALGQDDNGNKFIETVPTKGYRFVADVTAETPATLLRSNSNGQVSRSPDHIESRESPPFPTSAHRIPTRIVLFSILGLIVASLVFVAFMWNLGESVDNRQISLAILPLRPIDAGSRDAIYEIGIPDSLIAQLGRSERLYVRPLSAVRGYLDVEKDVLAAGQEQRADLVLASTYAIANGRVRVSSQLMNVRTGAVEETFVFDEPSNDSLAAQDALASSIGRRLLAKLNIASDGSKAKRGTSNSEAYRLYLQGINLVNRRGGENHSKAVPYFEKAIELDPNYALAWYGLGYARLGISMSGGRQASREA